MSILRFLLILLCAFPLSAGEPLTLEQAQKAANTLKKALGGTLKEKLANGDPKAAITFCAQQAIPLTNETGEALQLAVSRVTDKPRNPQNQASPEELKLMAEAKDAAERGESPTYFEQNGQFYFPMTMQPLCLTCHGEIIAPVILQELGRHYPNDLAIGYRENEFRGFIKVSPKEP
jgi:hypothetical protein